MQIIYLRGDSRSRVSSEETDRKKGNICIESMIQLVSTVGNEDITLLVTSKKLYRMHLITI